jgi:hypothetical protein
MKKWTAWLSSMHRYESFCESATCTVAACLNRTTSQQGAFGCAARYKLCVKPLMLSCTSNCVGLHHDGQPSSPIHVWLPEGRAGGQECIRADVSVQPLTLSAVLRSVAFSSSMPECPYGCILTDLAMLIVKLSAVRLPAGLSHTAQDTTASSR